MPWSINSFNSLQSFLHATAKYFPEGAWWIPGAVVLVLGIAALIDARTGRIPDRLIFPAAAVLFILQVTFCPLKIAGEHLLSSLIVGCGIWGVNALYRHKFRRDALGMGDAKWSMLAALCFGLQPTFIAWGAGSCLAVLWIFCRKITRQPATHVHFAPFLFVGLLMGLWWIPWH